MKKNATHQSSTPHRLFRLRQPQGGRCLKVVSAVLAIALSCGFVPATALAQTGDVSTDAETKSEADDYTKGQVVYSKLSATGEQEGVYVVNTFVSERGGMIADAGTYLQRRNLTDDQQLAGVGLTVFETEPNVSFSYQGDLSAGAQMPWTVQAGYKLGGESVSADELGGAAGTLEMTLDIAPNAAMSEGAYADNYLLQVTAQLSNDCACSIVADGATSAQASGSTQLTYMVFPGQSAHYSITAQVEDFEFSGWQIVGVPLSIALSLDESEFSSASEQLGELESAISSVDSGSALLSTGIKAAAGKTGMLSTGLEALRLGSATYLSNLNEQAHALQQASGASSLDEASANLQAHLTALGGYSGTFANAFGTAFTVAYAPAFAVAYQSYLAQGYTTEQAMVAASADASTAAASAGAQAAAEAGVTEEAIALMAAQAGADASDIGNLSAAGALDGAASGYADLDAGITSCSQGSAALESGLAQISEGAGSLADGTAQLASETNGLSKTMIDTVRDKLTSYLNPSFTLTDFANGSAAHIERVQFVYMTASIEAPDANATQAQAQADGAEASFLDKLSALFGR